MAEQKVSQKIIADDLVTALKARDTVAVETLRGLKTRIQNERISKGLSPAVSEDEADLSESDLTVLIRSELKKRKDAIEAFTTAGRQDMADKEKSEADILSKYLPDQLDDSAVEKQVEEHIAQNNWTEQQFGSAMGAMKKHFGDTVDSAKLSQILKNKLKPTK